MQGCELTHHVFNGMNLYGTAISKSENMLTGESMAGSTSMHVVMMDVGLNLECEVTWCNNCWTGKCVLRK
jgi:hypothetical protein